MSAVVQPFRADFFWDPTGRTFLVTVGLAIALLLTVSCLNASGLLVAHTMARRREMSVRAALGAGRWRLARDVMVETGLLTTAGLVGGVLLGRALLEVIQATAPWVPLLDTATVDGRVLLGCALLGLLVWLVAGLAPALLGSRVTLAAVLKESSRTSSAPVHWARRTNIVLQFAVGCTLMTGAAVAVHGYVRLVSADLGFDERGVAVAQLVLPGARYSEPSLEPPPPPPVDLYPPGPGRRVLPEAHAFTRRVMERLRRVPGVATVAAGTSHPFEGLGWTGYFLEDLVDESIPFREKRQHGTVWVTPGYFEALDVRLLEGRFLQDADDEGAPPVVVVNRSFADSLRKAGVEPLGSTVSLVPLVMSGAIDAEVVGVVANTILKPSADVPDPPAIYLPFAQQGAIWERDYWSAIGARTFVVRAANGDAGALLPDIQRAVWSVDPDVPFGQIRTLSDVRAEQFRFARFILLILGGFAAFAVLLAAVAMFALLAQAVRLRVHEIGIRRALGSSRGGVAQRLVAEGLRTAGLGILLGVAAAMTIDFVLGSRLTTARWAGALAIEDGWDVRLQVMVVLILATVAVLGSWGPAWVASRVDPLDALKAE